MARFNQQSTHNPHTAGANAPSGCCWRCGGKTADAWICPSCEAIQPLPPDLDYFACLGVPRHLQLDPQALTASFHERSRRVHPDFFQTRSERERTLSLEASALLNRAYRTLRDPVQRMAYLVQLETGQSEITAKAPDDLLEEIFALQELLESYRERPVGSELPAARQRLMDEQARLQERLARLDEGLRQLSGRWDRAEGSKEEIIAGIQEHLARRKYLVNTIEDLALTVEGRSDAKDRRH